MAQLRIRWKSFHFHVEGRELLILSALVAIVVAIWLLRSAH